MTLSPRAIAPKGERPDRHGIRWRSIGNGSTERLLLVATIVSLLFAVQFGNAYAAGPYEGEWKGTARATKEDRCKPADVALTVLGDQATGQAKFDLDTRSILGTVRQDGTLGATIGFQHLTGKFAEDRFEGTFRSFDCAWNMILRRSPAPRTPMSGRP
jgi:hypothetical protein